MSISIRKLLEDNPVEASAPCRVDSGGTWDIKALSLPLITYIPTTVNIALSLRTKVRLSPFKDGFIRISSTGFPKGETFSADGMPLNSGFGLFFAACACFDVNGVEIHIDSRSPVKSALGGSSTALVALVKALSKVSSLITGKNVTKKDILHLAYHLEDAVNGGNCGIQDQAAAVYGGVNQWKWDFRNRTEPFTRFPLLDKEDVNDLSKHLIVAYSGKSHVSLATNRRWIKDFMTGTTRPGWIEANNTVLDLAKEIKKKNWAHAAELLEKETAIRKKITPEAFIPITERLVDQAKNTGCGARFAGAGAGGSLWALGPEKNIIMLKGIWAETLQNIKDARILDCTTDIKGVE